jgi:hypothetical protein
VLGPIDHVKVVCPRGHVFTLEVAPVRSVGDLLAEIVRNR